MKYLRFVFIIGVWSFLWSYVSADDKLKKLYHNFKNNQYGSYYSFRDSVNDNYANFLRTAWNWYEGKAPIPLPKDDNPMPPRPYIGKKNLPHINAKPIEIEPIDNNQQPKPIEPIKEIPNPNEDYYTLSFYGQKCNIRFPEFANLKLNDCQPNSIAKCWERLCNGGMNNAIRDCLEARIRYNLCDWAYLMFLDKLGQQYCDDINGATLLTAFLYCQSGYQMRLAVDGNKLILLYGSRHQIFNKSYFDIGGTYFYPLGEPSNSISICEAAFEGEKPMSLIIDKEQLLGLDMSVERAIAAERNSDMSVISQVPKELIEFYNTYPTSALESNSMTRWAMYANTPLADKTKERVYPALKKVIAGDSKLAAVNKLLNWVQTGFVYEYDDKVWGHDRAFFTEETLFYPYADCEDRSILFSRLVRDLLDLDVALIYYPGHLATAVFFGEDVNGDAMMINGHRFIVCDPTYIGAPAGAQMPDLEYDKAQAIVLKR